MSSEWREVKFSELCDITRGGSPRPIQYYLSNTGMPWVKIADATKTDSRFIDRTNECIKLDGVRKSVTVHPGDLILSNSATPGLPKFMGIEACIHDGWMLLRNFRGLNKQFSYWLLLNERKRLVMQGNGSVFTNLKTDILKNHVVRIPSESKQEEIAYILDSIADKVELNRQTNQTLEQIAQAIFKSWFVDFDPVRAKIAAREEFIQQHPEVTLDAIRAAAGTEGDTPAHAAAKACELAAICAISGKSEEQLNELDADSLQQLKATAAFFPENLVETEHGELPEGWAYKALDEIAHYQNGLALQKFRPQVGEESLPVVKISQLSKGFADGEERASANIKRECIIENGDVVFSWSGSLMVDIWCGGKAALNQHLFKVTSEGYPKWFYYHYTKHHLSAFQQIAADKAVTMGHIKRSHLTEAMCAVPAAGLGGITLMVDLLNKQIEMRLESYTLQVVRDALLPKLLSDDTILNNVAHPVM